MSENNTKICFVCRKEKPYKAFTPEAIIGVCDTCALEIFRNETHKVDDSLIDCKTKLEKYQRLKEIIQRERDNLEKRIELIQSKTLHV